MQFVFPRRKGLLAEPGSEVQIVAALRRFMGNSECRSKNPDAARARAQSYFDEDPHFQRLADFYGRILTGPHAT